MKLLYSRFFPPRNGQAYRYYFYDRICEFPKVIKASWQRARRGWANCDIWSMDAWFCNVVPDMLRYLADNYHGIPIDFAFKDTDNNVERDDLTNWPRTLRQIADDLEALERYNEKWFYREDALYNRENYTQCIEEEIIAEAKVKAGLLAFIEYFRGLWD